MAYRKWLKNSMTQCRKLCHGICSEKIIFSKNFKDIFLSNYAMLIVHKEYIVIPELKGFL